MNRLKRKWISIEKRRILFLAVTFLAAVGLNGKSKETLSNQMFPLSSFLFFDGSGVPEEILKTRAEIVMPSYLWYRSQMEEGMLLTRNEGESRENLDLMQMENLAVGMQEEDRDSGKDPYAQAQISAETTGQPGAGEKQTDIAATYSFVPHTQKQLQLDKAALQDYESLVRNFYTIDSSTMAGSDQLNYEKLMQKDVSLPEEAKGAQILIYHTHSQEAFADSEPGKREQSIIGVGDHLTEILTQQYGYQVLHYDACFDLPVRNEAYSTALPVMEKVLEENPQIQVVIDLHRDSMDESVHLVTDLDGRPTARFMFFNGLSRTRKTGNISYLYNEYIEDNLAFSFQMEKAAMEYYPGLTRKIYLKAYRYNMHLCPRTLLVELGAQNNTVEEAMNACDPLAHILDIVLRGENKE